MNFLKWGMRFLTVVGALAVAALAWTSIRQTEDFGSFYSQEVPSVLPMTGVSDGTNPTRVTGDEPLRCAPGETQADLPVGAQDNYVLDVSDPNHPSPSQALLTYLGGTAVLKTVDDPTIDRYFAHTFDYSSLPVNTQIVQAQIEFGAKPTSEFASAPGNDTIALDFLTAGGSLIASSNASFSSVAGGQWTGANFPNGKVFFWDLGAAPLSIANVLALLNANRALHFVIQDDTNIDYAVLHLCSTKAKYEYVAKIVCGRKFNPYSGDDSLGHRLEQGAYSTTVNLYNQSGERAAITKYLALSFPPGSEKQGERYLLTAAPDILDPGRALEASCDDIAQKRRKHELNIQTSLPNLYIEGYLVIDSSQELTAKAVYTTSGASCLWLSFFSPPICYPLTGTHSGLDVENVQGRPI